MAVQRHKVDKIQLSLFDKEATYDAGPGGWTSSSACLMQDFPDDVHEEWDDLIIDNDDVVSGFEAPTHQEIARQSFRLNYSEPRAKPNTMAGLMALALGSVTAAQNDAHIAYRHAISSPADPQDLPSIGAQTLHEGGRQYEYSGIKADGFTIALNGAYWQFAAPLIGSGTRATAADAFVAAIAENWLRKGDGCLWIKDTGGTPITLPDPPVQGAANLGGSEVELSARILDSFSITFNNGLGTDDGYRLCTGTSRSQLHPAVSRGGSVSFDLEVDHATEGTEIDYYEDQAELAMELNIDSGQLIDAAGEFKYGAIIILPRVQLMSFRRVVVNQREVFRFEARIMNDMTNPFMQAYVYTARAVYLA